MSQSPVWTLVPALLLCRCKHCQLLYFHPQYEHFSRLVQESLPCAKNTQKQGSWQYTVYCQYTDPEQDESFQHPKCRAFYIRFLEGPHCRKDFSNQFPTNSLLKSTPEKFDDLLNVLIGNKLCFRFSVPLTNRRGLLKSLNVFVYHTGSNCLNLHIADNRIDIVGNQGCLTVIHRHTPIFSPHTWKQNRTENLKLSDYSEGGMYRCSVDFQPLLSVSALLYGYARFPISVLFLHFHQYSYKQRNKIFTFDNRCHIRSSFLS